MNLNGYTSHTDLNILNNLGVSSYNNTYVNPINPMAIIPYLNSDFSYNSFLGYTDLITTTYSEVNSSGTIFNFSETNGKVNIVSTSAQDTLLGTGIQTLLLNGLNTSYVVQTETINLSGTTQVQTTNDFHRINSITPLSIGSNLNAVGTITLSANTGTNIHGKILAGESNCYLGRYTIPHGYYASFDLLNYTCGLNDEIIALLKLKPDGLPIIDSTKYIINANNLSIRSNSYFTLDSKTDMVIYAKSITGSNKKISFLGSFYLIKK